MNAETIRSNAFAMPFANPAYPRGPYKFYNRESLVITCRTDPEKVRRAVPEPLEPTDPIVKYEFIRMPDSTGFGEVLTGLHMLADLTLGLGKVVHDYFTEGDEKYAPAGQSRLNHRSRQRHRQGNRPQISR